MLIFKLLLLFNDSSVLDEKPLVRKLLWCTFNEISAKVGSFLLFKVILPCDAIWLQLTPFHKIPKIKSGIVPHMLVDVLTKFGSDWDIFYLFMTSFIYSLFTTFFADQLWASSSLVVADHQSSNYYYFWITNSFHTNGPSLESYDVAVYGFLCSRDFTYTNFADISIFYINFRILRGIWHVWSARMVIIYIKSNNLPFLGTKQVWAGAKQ